MLVPRKMPEQECFMILMLPDCDELRVVKQPLRLDRTLLVVRQLVSVQENRPRYIGAAARCPSGRDPNRLFCESQRITRGLQIDGVNMQVQSMSLCQTAEESSVALLTLTLTTEEEPAPPGDVCASGHPILGTPPYVPPR